MKWSELCGLYDAVKVRVVWTVWCSEAVRAVWTVWCSAAVRAVWIVSVV